MIGEPPTRVLLKTTIGPIKDDWHVGRFAMLARLLGTLMLPSGNPLFGITARDRDEDAEGNDVELERAADGEYDQLWLFGVDATGALTDRDLENVARFRACGGGVLLTRDHQDLGACLSKLPSFGATQNFQTSNPEFEVARRCIDDVGTATITWPNYHSGANGDFQEIEPVAPLHPLMTRPSGAPLRFIAAHPHEGAVGVPDGLREHARVVAIGRSRTTQAQFNLCVAIEEPGQGRVVSDSSFHHFCDYNWNPALGAPSFVDEPPGDGMSLSQEAADDARRYAANIALWLSKRL